MKRRWFGIMLVLFSSILPLATLFSPAPALADASGSCITGDTLGCVVLNITLNPAPPANATVTVKREAASNTDNEFTLSATSPGQYTSGGTIWGTDNTTCQRDPSAKYNFFDVTVSGSATGSKLQLNLCYNESPSATRNGDGIGVKSFEVPVSVVGASPDPSNVNGGIKGTLSTKDLAGNVRACGDGANVMIGGVQFPVTPIVGSDPPESQFNTGITVPGEASPGKSYDVQINCPVNGNAGIIQVPGVKVISGQITDIGKQICDVNVNNCGGQGGPVPTQQPDPNANQSPVKCNVAGLSWIVCPLIDALNAGVSWAEGQIKTVLSFDPLSAGNNGTLKSVWAAFRDLANVGFVLVFMLVIFGQALGYDNYTIKKIMPRLVAAAILIQFSWTLMGLAVDVSNILGQGVASMVSVLPGSATLHTDSGATNAILGVFEASTAAVAGIVIATATVGLQVFIPILLVLGGLMLTILLTFLTLELRILILQVLIVLAPVAILAWVLPNTESVFRKWRTALTDLLLLYPIIMLIFLGGALFNLVSSAADGSTFNTLVGSLGPLFAFGLVPAAVFGAHEALKFASNKIAGAGINQAKRGMAGKRDDYKKRRSLDKADNAAARLRSLQETGGPKTLGQHLKARHAMNQVGLGFTSMNSQSAPVQARLAAAISKSDKAREDAALQRFSAQDPSVGELVAILKNKNTEEPEMRAAITRLAKTGKYGAIANSRDAIKQNLAARYGKPANSDEIDRRYTDMLGSNYDDIKGKSILATSGTEGLANISSKHLATQQTSTFQAYGQSIGTPADAEGKAQARLETQLQTLQQSAEARSNWNASNGEALLKSLRDSGQHAVAADYQIRFFESDGRLKSPVKGGTDTATHVFATTFAAAGRAGGGTSTAHSVVAPSAASGFGGAAPAAPRPASPYGGNIRPTNPGPTIVAASSPAPAPSSPVPPAPYAAPASTPAPAPSSNPAGFSSRPTGTNPYGGTINIPRPSATGPGPRQSPRISERLVDPRVEGDSDNRLV